MDGLSDASKKKIIKNIAESTLIGKWIWQQGHQVEVEVALHIEVLPQPHLIASNHSISIANKSLAKKQEEIHEKLCGVKRKLFSFVQFSLTSQKYPTM